MHNDEIACGCSEYSELSRRNFIGAAGGIAVAAMVPTWLPRVVMAQSASQRDVIVSIFLSGGVDGLSMVAPLQGFDPAYRVARPTIRLREPDELSAPATSRMTNLDGRFGISPGMSPLYPAYQAGDLLVVHATGSIDTSRSHFDAQRYMEVGKPADPRVVTGWLGRHLATSTPLRADKPLRAMSFTSGMPATLSGAPKALPIPNPASFTIGGSGGTSAARAAFMATNYADSIDPLHANALDTTNTIDLLKTVAFSTYKAANGAVYPTNSSFANALKSAAALIKADVGVEAVHAFYGGWDTHTQQGATSDVEGGYMHGRMDDLAKSLFAFYLDVIETATTNGVTVVVVSEFGRNVAENGDHGTDHGRGNVMFALGKKINGGRVLLNNDTWPGLAKANLESGQDLRVTLDHRDVLAEIVQNRLLNPNIATVFPDYTPKIRNVTKP